MQKGGMIMRTFDYSFLNNGLLPANLLNLTTNIAELKTSPRADFGSAPYGKGAAAVAGL